MFNKLEPRADKLIFNIASQEKNFCDSFVYEPINIDEEKLGNLYMLGEIKDVSEESFYILNHIATLVKRNYYSYTQKPCLLALEETLKRVNEGMQELISQKKTEWIGRLHFIVGVLSQNTFYFTICGTPRIFFVRHGEVTDVGEKITVGVREITPQKIFRSVASGKIEKEDKIFMLTSDAFHSITREGWKEIVASPNPARKIKELCSSQKLTILNTGGILIISFTREKEGSEEKESFAPVASVKEKVREISFQYQKRSKVYLFFVTLKRVLKLIFVILIFILKNLLYLFKKILSGAKKLSKVLIKFLRRFKFFQKLEGKFKEITKKPIFQQAINTIKFFKKKMVFIPLLLTLVILCGFAGMHYQKREAKIADWRNILNQAQAKYKEGEIALIYGAEEKAIKSFSEVEPLIFRLEKSGYFKKELKEIEESTISKLQKLLNIEVLEDPEILATLGSFSIKFNVQKIALTQDKSFLFAADPSSPLFYKLNTEEKKGEFSLAPIAEGGVSKMLSFENRIVFFSPPSSVFFYLPEENKFSESQTLTPPYEDCEFKDSTSYKENLYFLDAKEGEIIKFELSSKENNFGSGKIWLRRGTKKIDGAKSIACDGAIWILDESGNIHKYVNGYFVQTLKVPAVFGEPTKIWTSLDNPFLYVLDPTKKRLTLLAKSGQIVKQYFSEKFDDLKDFWVSEDGKTIYLLNNNQVFIIRVEL